MVSGVSSILSLDRANLVEQSAGSPAHLDDADSTAAASSTRMSGMGACETVCLSETMDGCRVAGTASSGTPAAALEPQLTFVYLVTRPTQTDAEEPLVERFPPSPTLSALCVLRV